MNRLKAFQTGLAGLMNKEAYGVPPKAAHAAAGAGDDALRGALKMLGMADDVQQFGTQAFTEKMLAQGGDEIMDGAAELIRSAGKADGRIRRLMQIVTGSRARNQKKLLDYYREMQGPDSFMVRSGMPDYAKELKKVWGTQAGIGAAGFGTAGTAAYMKRRKKRLEDRPWWKKLVDKEAARGDFLSRILAVANPAQRKRMLQYVSDMGPASAYKASRRLELARMAGHAADDVGRGAYEYGMSGNSQAWRKLKELMGALKGDAAGAAPWTSNGRKVLQDLKLPAYVNQHNVPGLTG